MSVQTHHYLYCDGGRLCPLPHNSYSDNSGNFAGYELRAAAANRRWVHIPKGHKDYCPTCAKRLGIKKGKEGR